MLPARSAICAAAAALLALSVCAPVGAADCPPADNDCLLAAHKTDPVRYRSAWPAVREVPLAQRIAPAPDALVNYLTRDNRINGFPERPRAALLDAAFRADIDTAIAGLPAAVVNAISSRLVGIYFVEDLGGTGFTDLLLDANDQPVAGYIVFDAKVLASKRANAWATWKENTPFKADPDWQLAARIETEANDTRANAIQYILLHELAHVLAIGSNIHPRWDVPPKEQPTGVRHVFSDLDWHADAAANQWVSRWDAQFVQRANVAYYVGAKLAASDLVPTYARLAETSFPTLYAAPSPGDDFAESFVSYVHTVMLGKPWQIVIRHRGKDAFALGICWAEPRCAAKRAALEAILGL